MTGSSSYPRPGSFFMSRRPILGWAVIYLLIAGALQLYTSYPYDPDTAYHAAVGRLISEHGILHAFPWTPFSWLADHYADKELLFHLLFVPLAGLPWITAAKIVGTLSGAAVLLTLYVVLRAEGVRSAGIWAMVPVAASSYFIFRFALVRPFVLSIALAIMLLWAASRGRLAILAAVSAVYPWAYVAFWQLPCLLLFVAEAARLLSGERIRWKPAVVTIAGVMLGVALHPNAAHLMEVSWVNMTEMLFRGTWGARAGFEMGLELRPFPVAFWGRWLLAAVTMTVAGLILAWRNRRHDPTPLTFALAALGFGVLTISSGKFAEYFVPFSAAALALTSRSIPWRYFPQVILGGSLLYSMTAAPQTVMDLAKRKEDMPSSTASFLQRQIPPDSQVFTTDWDFTGTLMLTLPNRRFMVALDPTFFYRKDPERYRLWYRLIREGPPGSAEIIRRQFGARYVLGRSYPDRNAIFYQLAGEPGVRWLLVTDTWMLFDLGGSAP